MANENFQSPFSPASLLDYSPIQTIPVFDTKLIGVNTLYLIAESRMHAKFNEKPYSTEIALQKLNKTVQVFSANSQSYYLKRPPEVTETALKDVGESFSEAEALMAEFAEAWYGSRKQNADCPPKDLNERIDVKLCQNGKLDFKQMKKMVMRLNAVDDVLVGLDRIGLYVKRYQELCREKLLNDLAERARVFESSILNELQRSIGSEATRLHNQIERCNLYYQPAMKTKTLWVAVLSLAISSLAFLLTILKMLNYI